MSVLASVSLTGIMIAAGLVASLLINVSSLGESAFIAACFSLSSTPLVVKFTSGQHSDKDCKFPLVYHSFLSRWTRAEVVLYSCYMMVRINPGHQSHSICIYCV